MKTTTFQDMLNQAAEMAGRTRDKVPVKEQTMLQFFAATEFQDLFTQRAWPELIPAVMAVAVASRQFSKNIGTANEMGDILDVMTQNPQDPGSQGHWLRPRHEGFYEGDGVVYVNTDRTQLYVEYMLAYPGPQFADITQMTLAAFFAAPCPLRFRNILAHRLAGHLLASDGNAAGAGVQYGLAEKALAGEILRLPPDPPWRNALRVSSASRFQGRC